ncbi:hypothetical protein [Haladaptatus sp. NG-WS-4]
MNDVVSSSAVGAFATRYIDELLALLLMLIGVTVLLFPRADVVGASMVAIAMLAWITDWLWG